MGTTSAFMLGVLLWTTSSITAQRTGSGSSGNSTDPPCTGIDGAAGTCRPVSMCASQFDISQMEPSSCRTSGEGAGLCCPSGQSSLLQRSGQFPIRPPPSEAVQPVSVPNITIADINLSGRQASGAIRDMDVLERELVRRGLTQVPGSSAALLQSFFGNNPLTQTLGRDGLLGVETTKDLVNRFQLTRIQGRQGLLNLTVINTVIEDTCPKPPPCPSTKYRTADGSCNNLNNPNWGKSFTAYERILGPRYADGVTLPRVANDGSPLPGPRAVSTSTDPDADNPNDRFSLMFVNWGQFLDHDMTSAGVTRTSTGQGIRCCDPQFDLNPELLHPACFAVPIPGNDPFYSRFKQNCMNFVRSVPAPRPNCNLGPREQLNQLTTFIDGSQIYGNTADQVKELRASRGGLLKTFNVGNSVLLPQDDKGGACLSQTEKCFKAGDARANEQVNLAVFHTIWMREHNRIARTLSRLNPGWTDEILFQETRRIVAAELQHITFNEFLPLLLGRTVLGRFQLLLRPFGYTNDYNTMLNPSIINSFATAAYRLGHSMVEGVVSLLEEDERMTEQLPLSTQFFNPEKLYEPGNLDRFLRGMAQGSSQAFDRFVSDQLTNHLFEAQGQGFGLDLVALNIQRGRDHGLPGYNDWRQQCGLPRISSFTDLEEVLNAGAARALAKLYRNVDDVDLFPAGIAEKHLPDSVVGPTFACIVAEQFRRVRFGDRFWYEHGNLESSFSELQLSEIRKSNLARVICDNTETIQLLQPLVMLKKTSWNPRVPCNSSEIPRVNLNVWKNEPVWS